MQFQQKEPSQHSSAALLQQLGARYTRFLVGTAWGAPVPAQPPQLLPSAEPWDAAGLGDPESPPPSAGFFSPCPGILHSGSQPGPLGINHSCGIKPSPSTVRLLFF